jgi:hypothetical protein
MPESVPISGEIARVVYELEIFYDQPATSQIRVSIPGEPGFLAEDFAVAYIIRTKAIGELRAAAAESFRNALGDEAMQVDVSVKAGSVEIIVIVTTVAMVIQNYNAIIGGIGQAVENTRRAFTSIIGGLRELAPLRGQTEMRASWRPGPALTTLGQRGPAMNIDGRARQGNVLTRDTLFLLIFAIQTGLLISLLILLLVRT